jgi:hypothetical protein
MDIMESAAIGRSNRPKSISHSEYGHHTLEMATLGRTLFRCHRPSNRSRCIHRRKSLGVSLLRLDTDQRRDLPPVKPSQLWQLSKQGSGGNCPTPGTLRNSQPLPRYTQVQTVKHSPVSRLQVV